MHILLMSILSLGITINGDEIPYFELINNYSVTGNRYARQTNGKGCQIPYDPHGEYQISNDNSGQFVAGDFVTNLTPAVLNCHSSYIRIPLGQKYSVCENGLWIPEYKCERTCSTLVSTDSNKIRCYFNKVELQSCENPRSGTTAQFDCQPFHENFYSGNSLVSCHHGEWVGQKHVCEHICGEKRSVARPNIINGSNVKKGNYPWHVGIYKSNQKFICGGSIISLRIILTAAHCLTNYDGITYPKENYLVAVGKYYRSYSDERDHGAQYPTIRSLHVPSEYKGDQHQHWADIAVVVLSENLVLSDVVQPICIDWFHKYEAEQLMLNNQGLVTGWGYTMEGRNLSNELKELSVPYIPYDQCYNQVPRNFTKYVRSDKICGGYLDLGSSVCRGDSGGALAFPLLVNGKYYIRGIVSVSPATLNNECNSRQYGLYTSLSKYMEFVKEHYIAHETFSNNASTSLPSTLSTLGTFSNNASTSVPSTSPTLGTFSNNANTSVPSTWPTLGAFSNNPSTSSLPTLLPDDDDDCIITSSGILGQCQLLSACPDALNALQTQQIHPQLCGLSGTDAKVCCAVNPSTVRSVVGDKSKQNPNQPIVFCLECREYGQYVYDRSAAIGIPRQPGSDADECEMETVNNIINIQFASSKEFPHMARIGYESILKNTINWRCDGSLISDKFVLTVASCIKSNPKYVRLGKLVIDSIRDDEETQDFNISAYHVHPDYNSAESYYDNIGLLELDRRATLNTYVRPACLNTYSNIDAKYGVVSGWGFTFLRDSYSELLKITLESVNNSECSRIIGLNPYNFYFENGITETQICASRGNTSDFCDESGGAPLQISNSDDVYCTYKIIGLLSVERRCSEKPSVYTRVSAYIKWIEDIVWP